MRSVEGWGDACAESGLSDVCRWASWPAVWVWFCLRRLRRLSPPCRADRAGSPLTDSAWQPGDPDAATTISVPASAIFEFSFGQASSTPPPPPPEVTEKLEPPAADGPSAVPVRQPRHHPRSHHQRVPQRHRPGSALRYADPGCRLWHGHVRGKRESCARPDGMGHRHRAPRRHQYRVQPHVRDRRARRRRGLRQRRGRHRARRQRRPLHRPAPALLDLGGRARRQPGELPARARRRGSRRTRHEGTRTSSATVRVELGPDAGRPQRRPHRGAHRQPEPNPVEQQPTKPEKRQALQETPSPSRRRHRPLAFADADGSCDRGADADRSCRPRSRRPTHPRPRSRHRPILRPRSLPDRPEPTPTDPATDPTSDPSEPSSQDATSSESATP